MKRQKKFLLCFVIAIFVIASMHCVSFAESIKVTDENLTSAFQKFVTSNQNEKKYQITVANNKITVTNDEDSFTMDYDLTDKPTFTYTSEVKQGMTYDDFSKKVQPGSGLVALGYVAVADIQGVEYEDSLMYFAMCLLSSAFSGNSSANSENVYIIIDDTQMSEGVTIEKDPNDTSTIYASEFGDRIMEYVNSLYPEKKTYKDSDGLNSFEMSTERKDVTDTSCNIVTSLVVNTDVDFSQIKGYVNKLSDSLSGNSDEDTTGSVATPTIELVEESTATPTITPTIAPTIVPTPTATYSLNLITSNTTNSTTASSSKNNTSTNNTITILPYAGTSDTVIIISILAFISIITYAFVIKNKTFKEIK